jgi:pimeloyl-ACP methyl ester carboxylesterase
MKTLIVVVLGFSSDRKRWIPLIERLQKETEFGAGSKVKYFGDYRPYRLRSLRELAYSLEAMIDEEWTYSGPFEEIILLGHSMGGLILRQAYLIACGVDDDTGEKAAWAEKVKRIIFFAAINRGINPNTSLLLKFLNWVFRVMPFIERTHLQDVMRGSDFITNLRIQWIRYFDTLAARAPIVVQFLGDEDGLVHREDSIDLEQFPTAYHITLYKSTHNNLFDLLATDEPDRRFSVISNAILRSIPDIAVNRSFTGPDQVIFILHGIRASNRTWVHDAAEMIRAKVVSSAGSNNGNLTVVEPTYGYFSALKFAFPVTRRQNLQWFQDEYTEYLARNPKTRFHFLGHSNGTYLLGESLRRIPGMKFERVALASSVLPTDYPWLDRFKQFQVLSLRNDRANRDVPVGILCNGLRGIGMKDVGTSGFDGFRADIPQNKWEIYWYNGGHSKPVDKLSLPSYVDFLIHGDVKKPETADGCEPTKFAKLSLFSPLLARVILAALIIASIWWVGFAPTFVLTRLLAIIGGVVAVFLSLDLY